MSDNPEKPKWGGDAPQSPETPPSPGHDYERTSLPSLSSDRPWGCWATLLWAVFIMAAAIMAALIALPIFKLFLDASGRSAEISGIMSKLASDGDFAWITYIIQALLWGLLLLVALFVKRDYGPYRYLGMQRAGLSHYVVWPLAMVAFLFVTEGLYHVFGIETAEWMVNIYTSARCMPCLLFVIVIVGPLFEEIVFRGFLYKGVSESIGHFWAVLLITLVWTVMHVQYNIYHMLAALGLGLLLGLARWKSGSVYVPIVMHVVNNALATFQMLYLE